MRFAEFEQLGTARLVLRKITRADTADYYEQLGKSEEVTKYMLFQPHKSLADSVASIEKNLRRYETGRNYRWAIALQESDGLIGIIDLLGFNEAEGTCSFAYMLAEDAWGRGFGTEALSAVLEYAFDVLQMAAVEADHFSENPASGAVMRKAGMQYLGTEPGKYEKNGIAYDAPRYRITAEQWKARNS